MAVVIRERRVVEERLDPSASLAHTVLESLVRIPYSLLRRAAGALVARTCLLLGHEWEDSWPSARRSCGRCCSQERPEPGCRVRPGYRRPRRPDRS